jgi:phosphatidate cytidylyltransferase
VNLLRTRVLTAVVAIPLFVAAVYVGNALLGLLVLLLALVGYYEFSRLWAARGVQLLGGLGYAGVTFWVALAYARTGGFGTAVQEWPLVADPGILLTALTLGALALVVFRWGRTSPDAVLLTLGGTLYTGWLWSHFLLLRALPAADGDFWHGGFGLSAFAWLCIWATDSFAYMVGMALGGLGVTKHKLAPSLSPGKSVEGLIGGLFFSALTGFLLGPVVGLGAGLGTALGGAIALIGHVGDLAESGLKRHAGVKDSGRLIPGHGGVLDRFDSALAVLPVVYYAVLWLR